MKTCCTFLIVITCFSTCHGCHNSHFCRKKRATTNSSNFGYIHGGCRRNSPIKLKTSDKEADNLRWLLKRFGLTDAKMNNELVECATTEGWKGKTSYSLLEKLVRATRLRKYKSIFGQYKRYYCVDPKHKATCQKTKVCIDLLHGNSALPTTTKAPSTAITRTNKNYLNTAKVGHHEKKLQEWIEFMTNNHYFKKLSDLLSSIRNAIITHEDYGSYADENTESDYYNYAENHLDDTGAGMDSEDSYYAIENLWRNMEEFIEHMLLIEI